MIRKILLSAGCGTLLLTSCNSKIDFGPDGGVSFRDARNVPQGKTDPTDWTADGTWSKKERALFSFDPAVDLNGTQRGGVSDVSFYPNPVSALSLAGTFNFRTAQADMSLKMVFVDRKYKVLLEQQTQVAKGSGTGFTFALPADKFKPNSLYRLYYVYYGPDGTLYYKGHGDVQIAD